MKVQNIQVNQNFKGYKNIVSTSMDGSPIYSYGFMAMKLNNEDGYRDLDVWKQIQKDLNPKAEPSDYIVFQNTGFPLDEVDLFTVNEFLLDINNKNPKNPLINNKERLILKANTLVASLTKRIMNSNYSPEDSELSNTIVQAYNVLKNIFGDAKAYEWAMLQGAMKRVKHHVTAKLINEGIDRNMKRFLKL